jgi:hypothetical protein
MKTDGSVPLKSNKQSNFEKNFFVGILPASDEQCRIRIRINMSSIHNTAKYTTSLCGPLVVCLGTW